MAAPSFKARLQRREPTIGSWLTLGHPAVAEIMATSGLDWIVIDMEHSSITLDQAEALIRVIDLAGCVPLVRVTENDPALIKRVMDSGAHGILVPMVNSADDAHKAVAAVHYPPAGIRAVGLARAHGYGLDFTSYREWADREAVVIVQIEHIDAVNALEAILAVPGVDGFIVGPYDLSGSLGIPGQFEHEAFQRAVRRIQEVAARSGVPSGTHVVPPDPALVTARFHEGYLFVAYSDDFLFLAETCRQGVRAIRSGLAIRA